MSSDIDINVTVKEKMLLHLLKYSKYSDELEVPPEVTQQGIAQTINALRPHVSLALKDFKAQSLISEHKANIIKGRRKQKVYFLEHKGITNALAVKDKVGSIRIAVQEPTGVKKDQTIAAVSKSLNMDLIQVLNYISPGGTIDLATVGKKPFPTPSPVPIPKAKPVSTPEAISPPSAKSQALVSKATVQHQTVQHAVQTPATHRHYPQQYSQYYPYYYPSKEGVYPEQMSDWYKKIVLRNNKILFSIGYIFLILGALFGILFIAHSNYFELLLGIIFIILGVTTIPVSVFELWNFGDLRRYLLTLITITIFLISIFFYFAILETITDSKSVIFKYEILTWFVIIATFFGVIIFGKFIPVFTRAELSKVIGFALVIFAPIGAVINHIDLFTALFWMVIAIGAVFVGNELSQKPEKQESLAQSLKAMHTSITMGLGLGIIFCSVSILLQGSDFTPLQYLIILLWFIGAAMFIGAPLRNASEQTIEGLFHALPIYIAVLLVFFGIFLIFYNKSIEALIEILLALVIAGYALKKILNIAPGKYVISTISLFLIAEVLTLLQVFLI